MVNTKFWNDTFISQLDPIEKLLFIYFLTNEHTNICGIYELPLKIAAIETGIDASMFEKILPGLSEKIVYIEGWVCVKNFAKHQASDQPKVQKGVEIALMAIPSHILDTAIAYGYPMYSPPMNSNSNSNSKKSDASVVFPKTYNNFRDRARLKLGKEPMGSRPMTQSQKRAFNELLALEPDISLYKELAGSVGFSYLELPEDANSKVRRQMLSARSRFQDEVHDFYRWIFTTSNPWPKKVNYHPESCITSIMFDAYKNRNSENKDNSILKSWGV